MVTSKSKRPKPRKEPRRAPRKRKNAPITLESHPHIKAVRSADDEDGPRTIVVTDLVIDRLSRRYDKAAFDDLVKHIEAWQSEGVRKVTIEGPWE